jgi:hypothetical protein
VGDIETNAQSSTQLETMGQTKLADQIWQKIERDWREIFAGRSDQSTKPSGICCDDEGEAQGEIPGQTVLQAAREHHEKDAPV